MDVEVIAGPSRTPTRTLKVLSFNVWGLAYISKKRAARECWVYKDFELIRDEVARTLPYARFFNSGALGSGLAIFTRYPLISAKVMPFDLSGTPQQAFAGDFFVNKAAANVVIQHPILGELEVWTTHMHAGGEHAPDTRQAHRIGEAWQLANAIRTSAATGRYVMVMGDFNAQPQSVPIGLMRTHGRLTDAFLETHPEADTHDPLPSSPEDAIHTYGMSCDSSLSTWTADKKIPDNIQAQGGKRLDYIFYRQPRIARPWLSSKAPDQASNHGEDSNVHRSRNEDLPPRLRCTKSELVLTELVPGEAFSYSDHFGLSATFEIDTDTAEVSRQVDNAHPDIATSPDDRKLSLQSESHTAITPALAAAARRAPPYAIAHTNPPPDRNVIDRAQLTLMTYALLSAGAARVHNRLSILFTVLLLALAIGSAWQPRSYIQPIFTLLGALLGAAAVTFFYLGFVWGRWEAGRLQEIVQEMELELTVLGKQERK